jgi:hypothetical protein
MRHEEKGNEQMITLTVEAHRKRPLTRPAQLEAGDHFRDAKAVSMRVRKAHSKPMKGVIPYPAYSPKGAADGRFER